MNKTINKNAMSVARKPSSGRHERKEVLKKDFKIPKTFIPIADELKNQEFKALITPVLAKDHQLLKVG